MFGSHLSIAGSMVHALREGERLGLDCVQVFTKNQQQWKVPPLDPGVVREWKATVAELGWDRGGPDDRGGITSHASYLINMASPAEELWTKSIDLMTEEIERCEALGIPYLVQHPGAAVGSTPEAGISRIAAACAEMFRRTRGYRTVLCFEGTAGAGTHLGGTFEQLAALRAESIQAGCEPSRLGFCLDTCHLHAAGYDLSTRALADAAIDRFDGLCGLAHLKALHLNDSKGKVGSHLDRHDHIGHGWVGGGATAHAGTGTFSAAKLRASGFAAVIGRAEFATIPKIMETPKGDTPDGKNWDSVNLSRLKSLLVGGAEKPKTTKRSPGPSSGRTKPTAQGKPQRRARSADK